jgi:hypothetical protein
VGAEQMVGVVGQDVQAVAVGRADNKYEKVAMNLAFVITLAVNLRNSPANGKQAPAAKEMLQKHCRPFGSQVNFSKLNRQHH